MNPTLPTGRALALLFACAVPCPGAPALPPAPVRVAGSERAVYRVENPRGLSFLRPYRNAGYSQTVSFIGPGRAEVTVVADTAPLGVRSPAGSVSGSTEPGREGFLRETAAFPLSDPLVRELHGKSLARLPAGLPITAWETLAALASEVAGEIRVRPEKEASRGALQTLRAGEGSCVGISNLLVTALRAAEIPARGVTGFLVRGSPGHSAEAGPDLLHRWVEAELPESGWIFADPAATIGYVTVRHIVLHTHGPDEDEIPQEVRGTRVTLLAIEGDLVPVEPAPYAAPRGLRFRRNVDGPFSGAAVAGRTFPSGRVVLLPEGRGTGFSTVADDLGRFSFVGIPSGRYLIQTRGRGGEARAERKIVASVGAAERVDLSPGAR